MSDAPKRPCRRDLDEALRLIRREVRAFAESAEANREHASVARTPEIAEWLVKTAGRSERRAARLARVLAWLEGVRG